jgi:hypothetical protein
VPWDEHERRHLEPVGGADLTEQRDVALPVAAEVEVAPTTMSSVPSTLHEDALDERQSRLLRLRLVERQHDRGVDAHGSEHLESLVVIGQQLRRRLGTHDAGRVTVEGDHRRSGTRRRQRAATWLMTA